MWEQSSGAFDASGTLITIEGLVNDITEKQKNELGIRRENEELRERLKARCFNNIVGDSPPMREVFELIARAGATEDCVVVFGESGTGKELVARAIHNQSQRKDGPWVAVNCAALTESLLESELFGHEKGAFTGADKRREGRFSQADGGTLFLDEIGELPLLLQAKLLRALQQGEVQRVGSDTPVIVDVRVIAATNKNLEEAIAAGTFREDLYYRINPMTLNLPPLSERVEDIPLIVRDVLNRMGGEGVRCTESAMNALMRYPWPGNIRELRNVLIRALSLCQDNQITLTDLPSELRQQAVAESAGTDGKLQSVVKNSEAQTIILALGDHHWNVAKTARALGISRASMYEKMRKFSIKRPPNGF